MKLIEGEDATREEIAGTDIVYEDSKCIALKINTLAAIKYWGRGTGWLDTGEDYSEEGTDDVITFDMFDFHKERSGSIYTIISKSEPVTHRYILYGNEYLNTSDKPIYLDGLMDLFPGVFGEFNSVIYFKPDPLIYECGDCGIEDIIEFIKLFQSPESYNLIVKTKSPVEDISSRGIKFEDITELSFGERRTSIFGTLDFEKLKNLEVLKLDTRYLKEIINLPLSLRILYTGSDLGNITYSNSSKIPHPLKLEELVTGINMEYDNGFIGGPYGIGDVKILYPENFINKYKSRLTNLHTVRMRYQADNATDRNLRIVPQLLFLESLLDLPALKFLDLVNPFTTSRRPDDFYTNVKYTHYFPSDLAFAKNLEYLKLDGYYFRKIPRSMYEMKNLVELDINHSFISEIEAIPPNLEKLKITGSSALTVINHETIINKIGVLRNLKVLDLSYNKNLESCSVGIFGISPVLQVVDFNYCEKLKFADFGIYKGKSFPSIKRLNLKGVDAIKDKAYVNHFYQI
jgi:Leucine-rich repeat (LRR) protein